MALPRVLKDFNLFGDGESYQGQVPELTLPELSRKVEEYRAGGMDGPIELDLGNEVIVLEWTAAGLIDNIWEQYGAPTHDGGQLRFRGSYESDETGTGVAVEIVIRGRHKMIAMGDAKPGETNQIKVATSCSYYKLTVDGKDTIEIDQAGLVFAVNGTDRLADRRSRLGL